MIWPYKRTRKLSFAERVAEAPMPPCGDKQEHYDWEWQMRMCCPLCAARQEVRRRNREQDQLAEKIAIAVVRKMNLAASKETSLSQPRGAAMSNDKMRAAIDAALNETAQPAEQPKGEA
ncbi:MAG: hypothetical protein WBG17_05280 [Burkholderiaceae bacterium]